jgi:hypothetical protein
VVEDPFGASMCLVLVGLFFAYKLYQQNLITMGDYYRQRYGRVVEVCARPSSCFSYLGWVAAQITAWGWCSTCSPKGLYRSPWAWSLARWWCWFTPVRRHVVGGHDRLSCR